MWSLLDPGGAALRVGPVQPAGPPAGAPVAAQRHRAGTPVAETDLVAAGGRRLRVVDALPWAGPGTPAVGRLVRVAEALAGRVDVVVVWRPGAGWRPPRRVTPAPWGAVADRVALRAGVPLAAWPAGRRPSGAPDVVWRAVVRLDAGERLVVTVDGLDDPRHPPLREVAALDLLEATTAAWRWWSAGVGATGPHAAPALQAAVVLRSLTPGAGGAPGGAGTTSLPRWVGGSRTSDGRWTRWRDAAGAVAAWARLGLADEAAAAEGWLRQAAESVPWPWPAALGADAAVAPEAEELPLAGWRRSQPVRVGLAAGRDLDLLGDVVAAVSASAGVAGGDVRAGRPGGPAAGPLTGAWGALAAAADRLADAWPGPDGGVWGVGGPPRPRTATRVQAWAALDRMARLQAAADPLSLDAAGWRQAAAAVAAELERTSVGARGALLAVPGDPATAGADAALLRVAWRGPWPPGHPVVAATVDAVLDRLGGPGPWVQRLPEEADDGIGGADGADVVASLWAVRALAALGRWDEAHPAMEGVLAVAGPGGVLGAAVDPRDGSLLGDLPDAGAHLAVLEAAAALAAGPT